MLHNIDLNKFLSLFTYVPDDPLLFSTAEFLFFFFAFLIFYSAFSKSRNFRVYILIIFSLFFYYKAAGLYFLLLIFSSLFNFSAGKFIGQSESPLKKKTALIASIVVNIGVLFYFKYTNFFIEIINHIGSSAITPLDIFLPVGISFFTFKALSYVLDVFLEKMEPEGSFRDFLLYVSFFPSILAGPIDRAPEFLPQVKGDVKIPENYIGRGIFLIIAGLFKKAVIADYIGVNFVDRIFEMPTRYTGVENLLAVYGYALKVYCDFSGYSDIAIGVALLMGFKLMDNFNSPYQAASIAEFWRRWHISLSSWLQDYLFRPLQMKFRNLRTLGNASALVITFLICGLWHGASYTFILWGAVHGLMMAFALFTKKPKQMLYEKLGISNSKVLHVLQVIITFHLIAVTWVLFGATSFSSAMDMFSQIFNYFKGGVFVQFVQAFPSVFALIIAGYVLHFIPKSFEVKSAGLLTKTPLWGKALILAVMIWVVAQAKSADLQPFIYFQF
ncbi:MAG: MBOAT family O-acyltransferase [Bacteroidota bacterium]|jgi:D-alanyl-lipoteichoic acid acyltransferase DltB (MBOAT superfamily)|nr:MBOAT family protein [Ignavibacteria bacterium]MCU7520637.1 MBOAT family protein [Ignavibacteria bacterium]MCU7523535.1 MBOAT family protein [Ignavibacteria bacterium]